MLLALLLVAAPVLALESDCFQETFPVVAVKDSPERQKVIEACSQLIVDDRNDPRPYYYRAGARYVGPPPLLGWNEAPLYDIGVAAEPDAVIHDYQQALARSAKGRAIPDDGLAWLRLGYLQASKGSWQDAVRAWRRAAHFSSVKREAIARLFFGQGRLIAPDRLVASPPESCDGLGFWDCAFIKGCSLVLAEGTERSYKGCQGKPMGLEPDLRPVDLDCSLLDENFCEQTPRCRWNVRRIRSSACQAAKQ